MITWEKTFLKKSIKPVDINNKLTTVECNNLMVNYYNKNKNEINFSAKNYNLIPSISNEIALGHLFYISLKEV